MAFDQAALEALAIESARSLTDGLNSIESTAYEDCVARAGAVVRDGLAKLAAAAKLSIDADRDRLVNDRLALNGAFEKLKAEYDICAGKVGNLYLSGLSKLAVAAKLSVDSERHRLENDRRALNEIFERLEVQKQMLLDEGQELARSRGKLREDNLQLETQVQKLIETRKNFEAERQGSRAVMQMQDALDQSLRQLAEQQHVADHDARALKLSRDKLEQEWQQLAREARQIRVGGDNWALASDAQADQLHLDRQILAEERRRFILDKHKFEVEQRLLAREAEKLQEERKLLAVDQRGLSTDVQRLRDSSVGLREGLEKEQRTLLESSQRQAQSQERLEMERCKLQEEAQELSCRQQQGLEEQRQLAEAECQLLGRERSVAAERESLRQESQAIFRAREQLAWETLAAREQSKKLHPRLLGGAGLSESNKTRLETISQAIPVGQQPPNDDKIIFNVGDSEMVSLPRSAVLQCAGSMLAERFGGSTKVTSGGNDKVFVDFAPDIFMPLVEHLRRRLTETVEHPVLPPRFAGDVEVEERFKRMLRYYGIQEWVYRAAPQQFMVTLGVHVYALLHPQPAPENTSPTWIDTDWPQGGASQTVMALPIGWEVLPTTVDDFHDIIGRLVLEFRAAGELIVATSHGGFNAYRTPSFASLGSAMQAHALRCDVNISWLKHVDNRTDQFVCTACTEAALVIRARAASIAPGFPMYAASR